MERIFLPKPNPKKKKAYVEGAPARKSFEDAMKTLFRAPKQRPKKGKD
jgi:hypothetical protein